MEAVSASTKAGTSRLLVCGNSKVELYSAEDLPMPVGPIWAWNSEADGGLPEERRDWLYSVDEVKPVCRRGEELLLCTASWRGCAAVIRRSDGRIVFLASVPNAHSIDLSPGGLLVVAGSNGTDHVLCYRLSDGVGAEPVASFPLASAHGAVWDENHGCFWTLGNDKLHAVPNPDAGLDGWRPTGTVVLPETGGHELSRAPGGELIVSTVGHVWCVDPDTLEVGPYRPLANVPKVKSVSVEPLTGVVAFTKGEDDWWTTHVHILYPDGRLGVLFRPGRRLYKVRWDIPAER